MSSFVQPTYGMPLQSPRSRGTTQLPWRAFGANATASISDTTASPSNFAGFFLDQQGEPSNVVSGTPQYLFSGKVMPHDIALFRFWLGHGSDANDKTATAWIFGLREDHKDGVDHVFGGEHLLTLALTGGATDVASDSRYFVSGVDQAWVDSITASTDNTGSPGAELFGQANDGGAMIVKIDFRGCAGFVLAGTVNGGTATRFGGQWVVM